MQIGKQEFSEELLEELTKYFKAYGITLVESSSKIIRFSASSFQIHIIYDNREQEYTLWIKINDSLEFELYNDLVNRFFGTDVVISASTLSQFIQNTIRFFSTSGHSLLIGDKLVLARIEKMVLSDTAEYNFKIRLQTIRQAADNAWSANDFNKFVLILENVSLRNLPKSYSLKFNIAQKKTSKDL